MPPRPADERLPWWPRYRYRRRGCCRCGAMHDSAVLDLTRPTWCSAGCYLDDDAEDRPLEEGTPDVHRTC